MTKDNKIVFINQGVFIRHPSERKTPPPPMWGEEENPGYVPGEPFYDARRDPYKYSFSKRALITKREFKGFIKPRRVTENHT